MLNKLANGKFKEDMATNSDVAIFVKNVRGMVACYGWENKLVYPNGYPEKIADVIEELGIYSHCTSYSKKLLIAKANGLADVMNEWEKHELQDRGVIEIWA